MVLHFFRFSVISISVLVRQNVCHATGTGGGEDVPDNPCQTFPEMLFLLRTRTEQLKWSSKWKKINESGCLRGDPLRKLGCNNVMFWVKRPNDSFFYFYTLCLSFVFRIRSLSSFILIVCLRQNQKNHFF